MGSQRRRSKGSHNCCSDRNKREIRTEPTRKKRKFTHTQTGRQKVFYGHAAINDDVQQSKLPPSSKLSRSIWLPTDSKCAARRRPDESNVDATTGTTPWRQTSSWWRWWCHTTHYTARNTETTVSRAK